MGRVTVHSRRSLSASAMGCQGNAPPFLSPFHYKRRWGEEGFDPLCAWVALDPTVSKSEPCPGRLKVGFGLSRPCPGCPLTGLGPPIQIPYWII
ncbi:hypothetical protein H6P81_018095 [Aristolochia fimbriata]|uniref:Uncharacterized protein n=1 Tax=Aristolochia fimbriata TaxID=158543 RepID=A0AAV7E2Y9_ARIFI|nr:hypothetical protein H6P81_018095 [Aristolochia fimbriata]